MRQTSRNTTPFRSLHYLAIAALAFVVLARGDTVKLKDGSAVEGRILSEDNAQVVVEVIYGSGSITKTETFSKTNVVEITRGGNEEVAKRQMAAAYDEVRKLQLYYDASFPLTQYDQVIPKLQAFVAKYPDHPNVKEVKENLTAWQNERAQVAAGKIKYKGEWLEGATATAQINRDRAQKILGDARTLFAQGKYPETIQQIDAFAKLNGAAEMPADAVSMRQESVTKLTQVLEKSRNIIASKIGQDEGQLAKAQEALTEAETKYTEWKEEQERKGSSDAGLGYEGYEKYTYWKGGRRYTGYRKIGSLEEPDTTTDGVKRIGDGSSLMAEESKYKSVIAKARAEVAQCQTRLDASNRQLKQIESRLAELQGAAFVPTAIPEPVPEETAKAIPVTDARLSSEGAITSWMIAGPYMEEGKSGEQLYDVEFPPEKGRPAKWIPSKSRPDTELPWVVTFDDYPGFGGGDRVAYIKCQVFSPKAQDAHFNVGTDDGVKVFVNGKFIYGANAGRVASSEDHIGIKLIYGWNQLLIKITNWGGSYAARARLCDTSEGPLEGLKIKAE